MSNHFRQCLLICYPVCFGWIFVNYRVISHSFLLFLFSIESYFCHVLLFICFHKKMSYLFHSLLFSVFFFFFIFIYLFCAVFHISISPFFCEASLFTVCVLRRKMHVSAASHISGIYIHHFICFS